MKERSRVRQYVAVLLFGLMVAFGMTEPYQMVVMAEETAAEEGSKSFTYANGDVYEGGFNALTGEKEGRGVYTRANGVKITGTWAYDMLTGKATVVYSKKERFVGHFKDDERAGAGTYYFKNGDKYKGNWKNDVMNGKGTYTWKNKNYVKGTWKSGKLNGTATLKLGKYKYSIKVSKGKLKKVYSRKKA